MENLLALVEGWVDAVVWRAGMAHIPHIEQLREMLRRERAIGGPAERTFESLMGMQLRPKRMREAAALWESIGTQEGPEARDAKWSHPDLLPQLPDEQSEDSSNEENGAASATTGTEQTTAQQDIPDSIDWDAELSKLLDEEDTRAMTPMARTTPTVQMTPAIRTLPATRSHRKKRDFLRPRSDHRLRGRAHKTRRVRLRHA